MSILQKLADNKIGIGLVIVHWITLTLAFKDLFTLHNESSNLLSILKIFGVVILIVDLPAMIPAVVLCLPIYLFSEDDRDFWTGIFFIGFFTITFQWLFVGKAIYNTFSAKAAKPISLSLNDD